MNRPDVADRDLEAWCTLGIACLANGAVHGAAVALMMAARMAPDSPILAQLHAFALEAAAAG